MTFEEFAEHYPAAMREALCEMNRKRLAVLADRGDWSEIGKLVWHDLDVAKHQTEEQALAGRSAIEAATDVLTIPAFLRKQAD